MNAPSAAPTSAGIGTTSVPAGRAPAPAGAIEVSVPNDYGPLRHVVWAPITGAPADWRSLPRLIDASLVRQAMRNRMTPFEVGAAAHEHDRFREVLLEHGVTVHDAVSMPGVSTQFGTRDIGFTIDDVFVLARPRRHFRQAEAPGLRHLMPRMSAVGHLDFGSIEGGDVALHDGEVLVGLSEETDWDGVDALRHLLAVRGSSRRVVPLTFARRGVIHMDTSFVVIGPHTAVAHPGAFDKPSLHAIRERFDLIEMTAKEAYDVEVNVVSLDEKKVIVKSSASRLIDKLGTRGFHPVAVDYDAVTTLPGSIHCTTLPLARDTASMP